MGTKRFSAVFEKRGRWYVGYVEEVPGVNTQGRTLSEVRQNLREALKMVLETKRRTKPRLRKPTRRIKEPIVISTPA